MRFEKVSLYWSLTEWEDECGYHAVYNNPMTFRYFYNVFKPNIEKQDRKATLLQSTGETVSEAIEPSEKCPCCGRYM
jgi:hypothetical protein